MSEFRREFLVAFGCDFTRAVHLALPRLRFELAAGSPERSLEVALDRSRRLFDAVFRSVDLVWVEIRFWDRTVGREQMAVLEDLGLMPRPGTSFSFEEIVRGDGGDQVIEDRYSARVPTSSAGIPELLRALVWVDHGRYRQLTPDALFVAPEARLGFFPYDDRGADLFARHAADLLPYYREFADWILDHDRPRMERELNLNRGT